MAYLENISQELLIIGIVGFISVLAIAFVRWVEAISQTDAQKTADTRNSGRRDSRSAQTGVQKAAPTLNQRYPPSTHPGKIHQWGDSTVRITGSKSNYGHVLHYVVLEEGPWPEDHVLIALCDGREPGRGGSLGGRVTKTSARTAQVKVHTD